MAPSTHAHKRATRLVAVAAAACLALTACGDDSDASSGTDSGTTSNLTGEPIKIGYAASQSGPQASNGLNGAGVAQAWAKYTNAHGGVDGHPVEFEIVDTKNTVPGATSVVQNFLDNDESDAILLTDLVAEGAMGKMLTDVDTPILSGGGSSDLLWANVPGTFQPVSGSTYTVKAYVQVARTAGGTKFAWAACAEVAVCQENGGKAIAYAKEVGLQTENVQLFSASAANYTAECLSYVGKGVDVIAMNIGIATGARVMADCLQQGYQGKWSMMNSGFDQAKVAEVSGAQTAGSSQGFPWWADDPKVETYRQAMKQYSPDTQWQGGNTTSVWAMLELFKKAMETAKPATIDRASILTAMYAVKDETLGGLLPEPVTFTEGQPSKPVGCSWLFSYNAGDENPKSLPVEGTPGNGATGDLASTCIGY
ncbi:ABC transporter substrate-binding protein [Phytohabitans sp. ZYX-F-186]|uniref:ABC transporter substrate-binding protein n=1 Tax=Phytohabitans maris TaxID=3071409 RepID=A0ABU0ZQP5_9ACTN|nr:ABC transporter substrate-binding protein [Phytohabitans sp. ZYX-F-186]MDQ7909345.1 ABC transporter substrate-binding protein [Phytohabitans sp. ZYX-F-186]